MLPGHAKITNVDRKGYTFDAYEFNIMYTEEYYVDMNATIAEIARVSTRCIRVNMEDAQKDKYNWPAHIPIPVDVNEFAVLSSCTLIRPEAETYKQAYFYHTTLKNLAESIKSRLSDYYEHLLAESKITFFTYKLIFIYFSSFDVG